MPENKNDDWAIGAILDIPQQTLKDIEKAEKAIESLRDTSENAAKEIKDHFDNIAVSGIDAFIKKLGEAKEAMGGLGAIDVALNTQEAVQSAEQLSAATHKTSADVSQAVQDLASLPVDTSSMDALAMSAEQAGITFKQLDQLVKNYERGRSQTAVESPEAMAMNNAIENLKEYIALKKKSDEQLARVKTAPEKDYLAEQKRLMTDLLNIRKQINAQSTKVQAGRITGNEKIKEEEEDLRRLFARYQESYRALQTLNSEKGKDLGAAARTEAEVNAEKYKTEVLKQQIAYRQKLSAEITRANELTAQGQQGKTRLGSGEEAAIQRQLNSDYKAMLKIIKEQGELKAKVAAEGRGMTQDEINLINTLSQRYQIYNADVNRIAGAYKNMAAAAEKNFQADKSEQLARNAILLADAQRKAAQATDKTNKALHDTSSVMQAYNSLNAQIERESNLLQQAKDKATQASAALQDFINVNPTFNFQDSMARLNELKAKIEEIKIKAASQGPTKASITMASIKPLQAEYDAILAKLKEHDRLIREETSATMEADDAVSKYTPRLAAMREESDRLSQKIEHLASANEAFNKELAKGNNVKSLVSEYKRLIDTIEQLGRQMSEFRQSGGNTNSASYKAMEGQLQAAVAREKEIRMMSINEVEQYRTQRANAAYQADLSAFVQAQAQKRAEAQKTGQQYAQSYAGAMKQFENMMTVNASGKLTVNLENVKRVLNDLQTAAGKLNLLDPSDVVKARKLETAIKELNRIIQQYKDVTNAKPEKPLISPTDAINAAKNARTLQELQAAYKNLKAVMATVDPKSAQWDAMNKAYSDTKAKIDEIKDAMGELHTQSQRTSGIMGQLQNRIAAAFSAQAIMGFIKKMAETRAEFELQNIALRAILQNKNEADRIFMQVQQMAMQSPFSIMQLNTYAKQLAAYRVESEKLLGTTKMLADVSAGLGVDMQRLILAYGQVKSANYLRATEVRQFTEAGLNIAGELASYFSELKGEMITVGDVMEMITKRMVKFEDVEAVFKRVTGAGGIFYDMQRKQSDSLRGQMQRIVDAYSIMMNEIGESSQSGIGLMLTLIRTLIQNWKVFANVLYGVAAAMGVYAVKTTIAAIAQGNFNASSKGLVGGLAKVKDSIKGMIDVLAKNPYAVLIGAAVAAGAALYDLNKKTNEAKEAYDKITIGLAESAGKLEDIAEKIEDAQQKIKSTKEEMSGLKKGTDEYTAAAEANKSAVIEQNKALQELRDKFPEVYAEITKTAEKTGDLTKAISEFYKVARMASVISTLSEGDVSWFNEDIKKDFEEVSKSQAEYDAQLAKSGALLNAASAKAQAIYETRKATGELTAEEEKRFKAILALSQSNLSVQEKLKELADGIYDKYNVATAINGATKAHVSLNKALRDAVDSNKKSVSNALKDDLAEAEQEADAFMQRILIAAGVTSADMFKDLPDETQNAAAAAGAKVLKELGLALDEVQLDIIRRKIEIPLGISFNFGTNTLPQLSHEQELINKYIKEHGLTIEPIQATDNLDSYFKTVKGIEEQSLQDAERYNNAKVQLNTKSTNAQLANAAKLKAEELKAFRVYFGYMDEEKKRSGRSGSGKDTLLELFKNRLKAIKDFYKQYEELQKNYSDEEALRRAQSAYEKLFKTLKIDMSEVVGRGMDKKGLAANIEQLLAAVRKFRPQLADEVEKELADVEVQIGLKIQTEAVEDMKKQMQEVADNFELSEVFRKLGVTADLVFMLGGKPTTLADYRKTFEDTYKQTFLIQEEYGKEGVKAYEEQLKKIEQLEQKNAIERAKNYSKYLANAYGGSAKTMLDYYAKLTQMEDDFVKYREQLEKSIADPKTSAADKSVMSKILENLPEQSRRAAANMREEMEKELAKLSIDKVLKSPLFSEMFQDLGSLTNSVLDRMIQKIDDIRNSAKNLTLSQVRQLAQYAEKLENAKIDNSPFQEAYNAIKEAYELRSKGITTQTASDSLAVSEEELSRLETLKEDILFVLGVKEKAYTIDGERLIVNGEEQKLTEQQKNLITQNTSELNKQLGVLNDQSGALDGSISKQRAIVTTNSQNVAVFKKAQTATEKFGAALQEAAKVGVEAINVITSGIQMFGGEIGESDQVWLNFVGNMLSTCITLGIAFVALGVEINSALGIIGIIAMALSAVANLFTAIFQAHDKKLEKQIENVQKKVDSLSRAFDKLKKAIDNAFSFRSATQNTDRAIKNAQAQIKGYREMIRLEQEKKKTDQAKIDEWLETIEDLQDEIDELSKKKYEIFGGFGTEENIKSAAEEFADAWEDGFNETGDGLDALKDKFMEFAREMLKKQVWGRLAEQYINPILTAIDAAFDDSGNMDVEKWNNAIESMKDINLDAFNERAKEIAAALGFRGGSGDLALSDLQKGIQNITEPQAAAIEAYMNSIRFAVFRHTEQLDILITTIQTQYGAGAENPVVGELRGIRSVLDNIYSTLRNVTENRTGRGMCVRVV